MTAQTATPTLTAARRDKLGRQVKALRRVGLVPAVLYGNTKENLNLAVDQKEFTKLYIEAGSSTLVNLKVDDDKAVKVLIHEVELHPTRHTVMHADFFAVNLKEKLRTEIPLVLTGVADAVEIQGGTLITVKDMVEVECLPEDLVHEIEIDISPLKSFEDSITVSDLKVPQGIVILDEPDQTLVSVAEPRSEEEMAALDETPTTDVETEFETDDGTKKDEDEKSEE
jgi:large subunit ribosomal protein L25